MASKTYATGTLTWTPASLADATYDFSESINNSVNGYLDAMFGGKVTTGTTPTSGGTIQVLVYGSWDGGTTYTAGLSGSDGGTPETMLIPQLAIATTITVAASSDVTYEYGPFSVAAMLGNMPSYWGVGHYNDTGAALNATAGNHECKFDGDTIS